VLGKIAEPALFLIQQAVLFLFATATFGFPASAP